MEKFYTHEEFLAARPKSQKEYEGLIRLLDDLRDKALTEEDNRKIALWDAAVRSFEKE